MDRKESTNVANARRFYQSGLSPDILVELAHPTRFRIVEAGSLPFGGDYTGFGEMQTLGGAMGEAFSDIRFEFIDLVGREDFVVVELVAHLTCRSSGKSLQVPILEKVTFSDGKIIELKPFYFDTAAMIAALAAG